VSTAVGLFAGSTRTTPQAGDFLDQSPARAGGEREDVTASGLSAVTKRKCHPATLTELVAAGKRQPIRVPFTSVGSAKLVTQY